MFTTVSRDTSTNTSAFQCPAQVKPITKFTTPNVTFNEVTFSLSFSLYFKSLVPFLLRSSVLVEVELTTQLVPIADLVLRLPGRESDATHELVFLAERLPPLGTTSFFVERLNSDTHNSDDGIKKTIRKKERPLPGGKAAAAAAAPGRRDLIISNEVTISLAGCVGT